MLMGFGLLVWLLFGGLLIALMTGGAVLLRQSAGVNLSAPSGETQQPTARQVLDERLARGKISPEEYQEIRARIEG